MSAKHLLLVDYENVPRIDLSMLDESYEALVFVGAAQNPPRAARNQSTAHRFKRVSFEKIVGSGKNALDFHAFHLGRMFETSPKTICIVVSRDKGYDPLLQHLNNGGFQCRRIDSFADLAPKSASATPSDEISSESVVCNDADDQTPSSSTVGVGALPADRTQAPRIQTYCLQTNPDIVSEAVRRLTNSAITA